MGMACSIGQLRSNRDSRRRNTVARRRNEGGSCSPWVDYKSSRIEPRRVTQSYYRLFTIHFHSGNARHEPTISIMLDMQWRKEERDYTKSVGGYEISQSAARESKNNNQPVAIHLLATMQAWNHTLPNANKRKRRTLLLRCVQLLVVSMEQRLRQQKKGRMGKWRVKSSHRKGRSKQQAGV